jgi:hypothetical protein
MAQFGMKKADKSTESRANKDASLIFSLENVDLRPVDANDAAHLYERFVAVCSDKVVCSAG